MGWLKEIRTRNNMTRPKLGELVGVSEQYVYLIEIGERRPSVDVAKRMAELLGFDWTRFFEDEAKARKGEG